MRRLCGNQTTVSDKEIVGRRVFGQKIFRAPRERDLYLTFFMIPDWKMNFDRLGIKTVDEEVIKFLTPQCHQHETSKNLLAGLQSKCQI
jgi:hypothetical protein